MRPSQPNLSPDRQLSDALNYHNRGQLEQAEQIYRAALSRYPDWPDALHLLGVLVHQRGRHQEAIQLIEKAIGINPSNPFYHCNLGVVYRSLNHLDRSVDCYQKALAIKPDYADAFNNLANVRRKQGDLKEALALYRKALKLQPGDAVAYNNLGHVYREMGMINEEMACYEKALQLDPDDAQTLFNLANAFHYQGELDNAIGYYKAALGKRSDFLEAHNNLGSALMTKGRIAEAVRCYQQTLRINPQYSEAFNNLGCINQNQGNYKDGLACFNRALQIKPDYASAHSNLLYLMQFDPALEAGDHLAAASKWWQQQGAKYSTDIPKPFVRANRNKIRLGFVSPDFRQHSVSYFLLPYLAHRDRHRFEIFCYSSVKQEDNITVRIREFSDHWQSIAWRSDQAVADRIRADGIDILVDLAGHTAGNRLMIFARRPAPVQVTWLGYPNTTGMPVMDYRLTDEIADPPGEAERYYSETLVHLPQGFLCYGPPEDAPPVSSLPARRNGYVTFGSFNNLPKVNRMVITLWSQLLNRVAGARLLLKSKQFADIQVCSRILAVFASNGIGGERIRLLPRTASTAGHLALYDQVDIGLDPFPYNGTTTTCEALWMGVPVITLRGDRHAGRVGASIMTRVGLPQLVAEDSDQYLGIGMKLAQDLGGLAELRSNIRARMKASVLHDAEGFAAILENTLIGLYQGRFKSSAVDTGPSSFLDKAQMGKF